MAAPKKYPRFTRLAAIAEVKEKGRSVAGVARDLGVTSETLQRWIKEEFEVSLEPGLEVAAVTSDGGTLVTPKRGRPKKKKPEEEPPDLGGDQTLESLKALLEETKQAIQDARAMDRPDVAQKLGRDMVGLASVVARMEKAKHNDDEMIRISPAEVKSAKEAILKRIHEMAKRPLLCAECGRRLAVETARGEVIG